MHVSVRAELIGVNPKLLLSQAERSQRQQADAQTETHGKTVHLQILDVSLQLCKDCSESIRWRKLFKTNETITKQFHLRSSPVTNYTYF